MAKIPYKFFPIPEEFFTDDFITDPNMMKFIRWIFKRISPEKNIISLKKQKRNLELDPFEFMFGRDSCSTETGISPKKIQISINQLKGLGFLKKTVSKTVSTFTVYTLVASAFKQNKGQQKGQQKGHNQDQESLDLKSHHPNPSSFSDPSDLTDDFSFPKKEEPQRIEVVTGIFLTKDELAKCIKIKGSIENVQDSMSFIIRSPGRKNKIKNWPKTLANWEIKEDIKPRIIENEAYTKELEDRFENNQGWRCRHYHCNKKDQTGILFESIAGNAEPVFFSYVEQEFKEKVSKMIKIKNML